MNYSSKDSVSLHDNNISDVMSGSLLPGPVRDIPVLMYHRVVDNKVTAARNPLCVHTTVFEMQLRLLEQWGYSTITFYDYLLYAEGKLMLPKKPVIITIDDGYLDTYTRAYPLLKEYGMKAVVFVLGNRSIRHNRWDETNNIPPASLMTKNHILELHREEFEIGAHTLTHCDLTKVSREEARKEIDGCRQKLGAELGTAPLTFSYPYGQLHQATKNLVRQSGFTFACSVFTGPYDFGKDLLEIRRITVKNRVNDFGLHFLMPRKWVGGMLHALRKPFSKNIAAPTNEESAVNHHPK